MQNLDFRRIALSAFAALIAAGLAAFLSLHRDAIFINHWQERAFTSEFDPELENEAFKIIQARFPKETCLTEWVGKDDRFFYLTAGCGIFSRQGNEIKVMGDANIEVFRFAYKGRSVTDWDVVDNSHFENSLRRLYPKAAESLVHIHMNRVTFAERGIKKAEANKK